MGYYSQLNAFKCITKLSRKEFFQKLEEFKKSLPEDKRDDFWCDFDQLDNKVFVFDLLDNRVFVKDLYGKHYADRELTVFFSKVIAPAKEKTAQDGDMPSKGRR